MNRLKLEQLGGSAEAGDDCRVRFGHQRKLVRSSRPTNSRSGRSRTKVSKAALISRLVPALSTWNCSPPTKRGLPGQCRHCAHPSWRQATGSARAVTRAPRAATPPPYRRHAAEQRDELAALHSITLSAATS